MSKFVGNLILLAIVYAVYVHCEYVTYVKMKNNKFEPVLEPVSSTVEPIPIYKLAPKLYNTAEDSEEFDRNTLLTVYNYRREGKQKHYDMDNHYVKVEPMN